MRDYNEMLTKEFLKEDVKLASSEVHVCTIDEIFSSPLLLTLIFEMEKYYHIEHEKLMYKPTKIIFNTKEV